MKHWKIKIENRLAFLTHDSGKPGNRLTPETFGELSKILTELDEKQVRGLVLNAEGDNFSQGFDLKFLLDSDSEDPATLQDVFSVCNEALDRLYGLPMPTMTLVKGACIGGGLLLALATDFRAADEEAKFGFPEVRQSLVVNLGLKRVYQLLGEIRTKELVLLGNTVSAKKLHDWGAINWLVSCGQFAKYTQFFTDYVHSIPPLALQANKKLIHTLPDFSMKESIDLENKLQMNVLQTSDFKEAISSFLEKRAPIFKGK